MSKSKKVVVIGGTGLVGSKAVTILRKAGHKVVVASSRNGINAFTGEGLEAALSGADAVIDVSNLLSFEEPVIRNFFETSSRNLTEVEKAAGVRHHVVLSIVGTDGLAGNPYVSGKQAQEDAVKASGQDYTIVRATQFYEFMDTMAEAYADGAGLKVPDIAFRQSPPMMSRPPWSRSLSEIRIMGSSTLPVPSVAPSRRSCALILRGKAINAPSE